MFAKLSSRPPVQVVTGVSISIELASTDQPILSGGQIQGKVVLHVDRDSISATNLQLCLGGTEISCVSYSRQDSTEYHHSSLVILKQEASLMQFPAGAVKTGHYEYPFVMAVPVGLPGKQGVRLPRGAACDYFLIEYFLEAHLFSSSNKVVSSEVEISLVGPPVFSAPTPSITTPQNLPVYFLGCYKTGQMQISVNLDNTNVALGETINFEYSVQNESSSEVKAVEFGLCEVVYGKSDTPVPIIGMGPNKFKYRDFTQWPKYLVKERVDASEVSGTKASKTSKGASSPQYVGVAPAATDKHVKSITLPLPTRTSYIGTLGSVTHYVYCKVIMKIFSLQPLLICIPVTIHGYRGLTGHSADPMGSIVGISSPGSHPEQDDGR